MTIQVLVCRADGTQAVETREVPSDWLPALEPTETAPAKSAAEDGGAESTEKTEKTKA